MSTRPASSRAESAARIRPAAGAALFGVLVGTAVGGAYLMGAAAKGSDIRTHALRLDAVAAAGFTEEALSAAAGGMNESALAIARRHDPYALSGPSRRDRQAELLAGRLERATPAPASDLRHASLTSAGPAARPFRFDSALDASRDLECLTQAVYYEARGEGRDGMRAVAQVVLNRARHAAFPKTVCGVVFQGANRSTGCQFSFTCNGAMRGRVNRAAWNRARDVASAALDGAVYSPVGSATHFHTTAVAPVWRHSLIRVSQVGDHVFYRFGGRAGSGRAFAQDVRPSEPLLGADVIEASYDPAQEAAPPAAMTAQSAQGGARDASTGTAPTPAATAPAVQPVAQTDAPRAAPPRAAAVSMVAPPRSEGHAPAA